MPKTSVVTRVSLSSTDEICKGIITPEEVIKITCLHRGPLIDSMRTLLIHLTASDYQLATSVREVLQNGESRLLMYQPDLLVTPAQVLDVIGGKR